MKSIYALLIALIATSTIITSCSQKKAIASNTDSDTSIPVKLAEPRLLDTVLPINISGLVASDSEAYLSFKTGGVIARTYAEEGQSVKKGQLLAALDLTEISAQVTQAKNGVDKANRDLERVKHLYADSAATLEQMQNATTAYDVAQQTYTIAQFNQQYSVIKAPVAGKVVKKLKNEGEIAGPGLPVYYINAAGSNNWIVKVGLADKDWARIKMGDKATVALDAYPDEAFYGKVTRIAEGADPYNGLYQIEIKIDPKGKNLSAGLFAKVNITTTNVAHLLAVPIESLAEGNGKEAFVYLPNADNKTVRKKLVRVAFLDNSTAYLSSGIEKGQSIITYGSPYLTATSTINIVK